MGFDWNLIDNIDQFVETALLKIVSYSIHKYNIPFLLFGLLKK